MYHGANHFDEFGKVASHRCKRTPVLIIPNGFEMLSPLRFSLRTNSKNKFIINSMDARLKRIAVNIRLGKLLAYTNAPLLNATACARVIRKPRRKICNHTAVNYTFWDGILSVDIATSHNPELLYPITRATCMRFACEVYTSVSKDRVTVRVMKVTNDTATYDIWKPDFGNSRGLIVTCVVSNNAKPGVEIFSTKVWFFIEKYYNN